MRRFRENEERTLSRYTKEIPEAVQPFSYWRLSMFMRRRDRHPMTQRHFIQNDVTMHVTTVTRNRYPFFADPTVAREAVETLYRVQSTHPFFLYAFVVMPDHIHLLVHIPFPQKISAILGTFKSGLTFNAGIPRLWQPRYHLRISRNPWRTKEYIHNNPVRARLSPTPDLYPWSSASGRWDISALE